MVHVHIERDLQKCRSLWQATFPAALVSDLWAVRECFQRVYGRQPYFVVAEEGGVPVGLLPLSWVPESECYSFFPGETWQGKTWLEQNRVIARDPRIFDLLMEHLLETGNRFHLRYMLPREDGNVGQVALDEFGYLFLPDRYNFDFDRYFATFSRKTAKKLNRLTQEFEDRQLEIRLDQVQDFDLIVSMNRERFGTSSYFADDRFTESFRNLMYFFRQHGWLRIITVIVAGEPAAVDLGCVYKGVYTLLCGGTNPRFPGIAKYINLYHLRRACKERMEQVDFLCGEFFWKPLFHLTPRPLYKLTNMERGVSDGVGVRDTLAPMVDAVSIAFKESSDA